jgi:cell division septation protein DedD
MTERRSEERTRRSGWKAAIALGVIGIVSGFTVGIVAGIGWEEPSLVFDYLTGDTEDVDWSLTDSATGSKESLVDRPSESSLPAVGASPRESQLGLRDGTGRAMIPHPAPTPASAARESLPGGGYSVQVGAFSDSSSARGLIDSLREKGYAAYVSRGKGDEAAWRVRVGPLRTRADAETTALQLESREKLPTWVLSEGS